MSAKCQKRPFRHPALELEAAGRRIFCAKGKKKRECPLKTATVACMVSVASNVRRKSRTSIGRDFRGDIAGYSRLMGLDEEGTLRQLKGIRKELVDPKITEHRGRIVKTTGDGILVEFVSVVDAVRCAVDIQRGMTERNADVPTDRRIEFRIGINVGDIIIDGGDIYGDGVNVAARLEALAQPNGILVSRAVHDQVQDKLSFNFEDIGEQSVKNITRPVRAFRIGVGEKLDGSSSPMRLMPKPCGGGLPSRSSHSSTCRATASRIISSMD